MNRRQTFIAVSAIAAAVVVGIGGYRLYADLDARGERPTYDPRWERCEAGDSCVAVAAPCHDWAAVNARHQDAAAAYYAYLMTVIETTELWCPSKSVPTMTPFAFCLSGQCAIGPQ